MWVILKEKETGYYGIQQYVKNSTAKPKGQTDRLDEGTLTRDDNFEDMLLKSSNLSKIVREKSKKTQSKIENDIRQAFNVYVQKIIPSYNVFVSFINLSLDFTLFSSTI